MGLDPEDAEDHVCEEGAPAWLATMGDLMSLLLTFFVLMLSFANMDRQLFLEAIGSIRNALGVVEENPGQFQLKSTSPMDFGNQKSTPFLDIMKLPTNVAPPSMDQRIMQLLQQSIAENNLSRMVEAESTERGVLVRVKGHALFQPGSDKLLPASFVFLDEIVRLTQEFPYELSIEGHTDDTPIHTEQFPDNWYLSSARAIAVLKYLAQVGGIPTDRLSASGFADTRPLVPNDSEEHRATNRRVEFVYKRDPGLERKSRAERQLELQEKDQAS